MPPVLHLYDLTKLSNLLMIFYVYVFVLHLYELTKLSNHTHRMHLCTSVLHLYELTKLSNKKGTNAMEERFYTFMN